MLIVALKIFIEEIGFKKNEVGNCKTGGNNDKENLCFCLAL